MLTLFRSPSLACLGVRVGGANSRFSVAPISGTIMHVICYLDVGGGMINAMSPPPRRVLGLCDLTARSPPASPLIPFIIHRAGFPGRHTARFSLSPLIAEIRAEAMDWTEGPVM